MRELTGVDIWDFHDRGDWICIPTNGVVKQNGDLVMGKGLALEAARRYPSAPHVWGSAVQMFGNIPAPYWSARMVSFPTKHHWQDKTDLGLIKESAELLMRFLEMNPTIQRIYLPRPGVGFGRLDWEEVRPVLEPILGDQVIVVTN